MGRAQRNPSSQHAGAMGFAALYPSYELTASQRLTRGVQSSRRRGRSPDLQPKPPRGEGRAGTRSEEHTSELQSLMRISYAVFCLKKKTKKQNKKQRNTHNKR